MPEARVVGLDCGSYMMDKAGMVHMPYVFVGHSDLTVAFIKMDCMPSKTEADEVAQKALEVLAAELQIS